jgi:hypothetical protein
MHPLSAHDILNIWERGLHQHPLDRALTILAPACPELTWEELTAISIVQRDARLFDLYEKTFGSTLKGFSGCPECGEHLEFTLLIADLKGNQSNNSSTNEYSLDLKESRIHLNFRFPNSIDLAAVMKCKDIQSARDTVARSCVIQATRDDEPLTENELSAEIINSLVECMAKCEPDAEILFDFKCPVCSHSWQMPFDIVVFLWKEISLYARSLLQEVHILASVYGWREEDILSMSPVRRKFYLEIMS